MLRQNIAAFALLAPNAEHDEVTHESAVPNNIFVDAGRELGDFPHKVFVHEALKKLGVPPPLALRHLVIQVVDLRA